MADLARATLRGHVEAPRSQVSASSIQNWPSTGTGFATLGSKREEH